MTVDLSHLLRSELLEEILRMVLLQKGEWTADDFADATEAPYPTVTKEIRRLERSGVVNTRVVGRTKFLSASTDDPATRALTRALEAAAPKGGEGMSKKKKKDKKKKK